jgi:hypothetical protein
MAFADIGLLAIGVLLEMGGASRHSIDRAHRRAHGEISAAIQERKSRRANNAMNHVPAVRPSRRGDIAQAFWRFGLMAASTARGLRSMTRKKTRAGPSGSRIPCSQLRRVPHMHPESRGKTSLGQAEPPVHSRHVGLRDEHAPSFATGPVALGVGKRVLEAGPHRVVGLLAPLLMLRLRPPGTFEDAGAPPETPPCYATF